MSHSLVTLNSALSLLLLTFFTPVLAAPPILDLEVSESGQAVDASPMARPIERFKSARGFPGDHYIEIPEISSLTVAWNGADPLFAPGPFTWIMKCQLKALPKRMCMIARRWGPNGYNIYLGVTTQGTLRAVMSSDGTNIHPIVLEGADIPLNEEVFLLLRFIPGESLTVSVIPIKEKGDEIQNNLTKNIPQEIPDGKCNLVIGAHPSLELKFYSFRVWNERLSEDEYIRAIQ